MKTGSCIEKIPDGKLLKVTASFEGETMISVFIRGDFFAHPEDVIERIEASLRGNPLSRCSEIIMGETGNAELFGVSGGDIARAIERCFYASQTA